MLWAKLSEIERVCLVRLESMLSKPDMGLRWRIVIQPRAGLGEPIVVEREKIEDAVSEAVAKVERANWFPGLDAGKG